MPKLLISSSTGPDDPTRSSIPFHIAANGAAASGVDCAIALAGDATALIRPGAAADVRGIGIPPLGELLDKCLAAGVQIHV
jgi:predicted peroxiredoxin